MSRQLSKVLMLSEACLADQLQHVHKVDLMAGLVENNGTQHLRPQELAVLRQVSLGAEAFSGRDLVYAAPRWLGML